MESCFGTLKTELVRQACYPTRYVARHDLFAYIEEYYNRQTAPPNRQSAKPLNGVHQIGGRSPSLLLVKDRMSRIAHGA